MPGGSLTDLVRSNALQAVQLPNNDLGRDRLVRAVFNHHYNQLREEKDDEGFSVFDYLVLDNMSKKTGKTIEELKRVNIALRNLEANPAMSQHTDFPSLHKKAKEAVLEELEARMHEPEVQTAYLIDLAVNKAKKSLERDYEAAAPILGKDKAVDYASCLLELQLLQTDPVINEALFKKTLLNSLNTGEPVQLVHIKSLRYTYPRKGGLKMLTDTFEHESVGFQGERRIYSSEEIIFERLNSIRQLLEYYGIKSELMILVADHDLEFLFPANNSIIDDQTKEAAIDAATKYLAFLKEKHPETKLTSSLSNFLQDNNLINRFENIYSEIIRQAKKGIIDLVSDKVYEMHVNHQFEHYSEMFGEKYTRGLARYSAMNRVADLVSLSVVFESFSSPPVVVIDGRGFETKLIGINNPKSRSIFLTKLKDPVRVVE